jgi:hypothetical protein
MRLRCEDGLILTALKMALNYRIWHWSYRGAVFGLLWLSGLLSKQSAKSEHAVRIVADLYMFGMTLLVVASYLTAFRLARIPDGSTAELATITICIAVSLYRLFELWSVILMLHANGPYYTNAPMRAISKTIWTYLEFVVIFASIHLASVVLVGDQFASEEGNQFCEHWFTPLYFSMVTMLTIGYGDFYPQSSSGRGGVVAEGMCGLLLLVVALQRLLSVSIVTKKSATIRN